MTDGYRGEDEELAEVGRALGYDEDREPPQDRVAALRAQAERMRATYGGSGQQGTWPPERTSARRRTLLVGGVAAAVGALAGAGARQAALPEPAVVPTEDLALTGVPRGVTADARLINHTWGTEVLLDVRDLPADRVFRVALDQRDGARVDAGSFRSVADVLMVCRFNAAPLRADVARVLVLDDGGDEVMRADLPEA
jgi:hypothetical protein